MAMVAQVERRGMDAADLDLLLTDVGTSVVVRS